MRAVLGRATVDGRPPAQAWLGMFLLGLLACGSMVRPADTGRTDPTSPEPLHWFDPAGTEARDFASEARTWSLGGEVRLVPDQSGDGLADAVVVRFDATYLVFSPLHRTLTLPRDAAAVALGPDDADRRVLDVTGDGVVDVLDPRPWRVHPGPWRGTVSMEDADVLDLPPGSEVADYNRDGVGDLRVLEPGRATFTWGPLERWAGPPDVVLELPLCSAGSLHTSYNLVTLPDLDGDGSLELSIAEVHKNAAACHDAIVPLPEEGRIVGVEIDPARWGSIALPRVVPDQTGDGGADLVFSNGWNDEMTPLPTAWDLFGVTAPSTAAPHGLYLPVDVDGDGIHDVVGMYPNPYRGAGLTLASGGRPPRAWVGPSWSWGPDDVWLPQVATVEGDSVLVIVAGYERVGVLEVARLRERR